MWWWWWLLTACGPSERSTDNPVAQAWRCAASSHASVSDNVACGPARKSSVRGKRPCGTRERPKPPLAVRCSGCARAMPPSQHRGAVPSTAPVDASLHCKWCPRPCGSATACTVTASAVRRAWGRRAPPAVVRHRCGASGEAAGTKWGQSLAATCAVAVLVTEAAMGPVV